MISSSRPLKLIIALLLSIPLNLIAFSTEDLLTETKTKAQAVYNILQFVEFPANAFNDPSQPVTICIVGYDSFGKIMDYAFKGKMIADRPVKIIRIKRLKDLKKTKEKIHVVYASRSLKKDTPLVISHLTGQGCLSIGETSDFCQQGGMIQVKVLARKARFNINTMAVWQEDLRISSQLLKLATIVETEPLVNKSSRQK